MQKCINSVTKLILILTFLATATAVANEDRTKKDLSEVQTALKQSQSEYNAQRKKVATLQKNLQQHELEIAKNAKALNMAEQSVKKTGTTATTATAKSRSTRTTTCTVSTRISCAT